MSQHLESLVRQRTKQMTEKHCRNNENMSQQKMSRVLEETLDLCCNIEMIVVINQRAYLRRNVATKVGKSSQKFVAIIGFMSRKNLLRSIVHGKERMW